MAKKREYDISIYIYMIYLLIYAPNNPPNVGKYGYLYTCTNLIDPIGYGKNMSMCTPKHLIFRVCQQKKMMNWSKLIGQYVPLKTGWPFFRMREGNYWMGMKLPENSLPDEAEKCDKPLSRRWSCWTSGACEASPQIYEAWKLQGCDFQNSIWAEGGGQLEKNTDMFQIIDLCTI